MAGSAEPLSPPTRSAEACTDPGTAAGSTHELGKVMLTVKRAHLETVDIVVFNHTNAGLDAVGSARSGIGN
jgi:hypothetical protein